MRNPGSLWTVPAERGTAVPRANGALAPFPNKGSRSAFLPYHPIQSASRWERGRLGPPRRQRSLQWPTAAIADGTSALPAWLRHFRKCPIPRCRLRVRCQLVVQASSLQSQTQSLTIWSAPARRRFVQRDTSPHSKCTNCCNPAKRLSRFFSSCLRVLLCQPKQETNHSSARFSTLYGPPRAILAANLHENSVTAPR